MISHVISARIILVLITFNLFVNLSAIHNNAQSTIEFNQPLTRDADLGPINWQLLAPSSPQAGPSNSPQAGPSNSPQAGPSNSPQAGPLNPPQPYNFRGESYVPLKIKPLFMLTVADDPLICIKKGGHADEIAETGDPNICEADKFLTTDKKKAIEDSIAHAIEYLSSHLTVLKDVDNFVPNFDWKKEESNQDILHGLKIPDDMFDNANHSVIVIARHVFLDEKIIAMSIPLLSRPDLFPCASLLIFNVKKINESDLAGKYDAHLAALHEMLHSIGFNESVLDYKNMLKEVEIFGKEFYGGKFFDYLDSPNVLKVARKHFGCNSLERAYFESNDHWHSLIYLDEIMSPHEINTRLSTELTFAALEDTKLFKVIIPGEPLKFGKGAGCTLPNDVKGNHSNLCEHNVDVYRCSSDGMVVQECEVFKWDGDTPKSRWKNKNICHKPDICDRSKENRSSNDFAVCDLNSIRLFENKPTDYIQYSQKHVCSNIHCLSKSNYITQIGRFYYPCQGKRTFKVHLFHGKYQCSPKFACSKYKKTINHRWPVIKSVNKKIARPGDIIVIKGSNFSKKSQPLICIEKIECRINRINEYFIRCKVGKVGGIKMSKKSDILYLDEENNMGNALLKGITIRRKIEERKRKKKEEQKKERLTAGNHPQPHNPNNSGTKPINSSPGSGSPSRPPKPLPVQPPPPVRPLPPVQPLPPIQPLPPVRPPPLRR